MNYRHLFHAGNFADVVKHVVLIELLRSLQQKEKGFLFLDTHAGRGSYDLSAAARGDSLQRKPEWPEGIGRLWGGAAESPLLREYLRLVGECNTVIGGMANELRFYPGSPWIARALARPQDRLIFCERHPEEFAVLTEAYRHARRASVREMDGYTAIRAALPPLERRALVLIDPPYEEQDEIAAVAAAVDAGLKRLAHGVFAIWYPLTERARQDSLQSALLALSPPPTLAVEVTVADGTSPLRMRGCGVVVVNPPWRLAESLAPAMDELARILAQSTGATARLTWVVPEP